MSTASTPIRTPIRASALRLGGYSVYEVADIAEANTKAQAFLQAHLDTWPGWEGWVEVRPLMEQPPQQ